MDVHDRQTRSFNMSRIRGKSTKPEFQVRSICHQLGFRYRIHRKDLPGKPDLVFPKYHAVIFVNGCFWHGHDCRLFKLPATRQGFWTEKIEGTVSRDQYQLTRLTELGWRVMTIWECALKGKSRLENPEIGYQISRWLRSDILVSELKGHRDES
ncbi:MAG: DNA mismatch endonuclease Vsr [Woeseia sp.]